MHKWDPNVSQTNNSWVRGLSWGLITPARPQRGGGIHSTNIKLCTGLENNLIKCQSPWGLQKTFFFIDFRLPGTFLLRNIKSPIIFFNFLNSFTSQPKRGSERGKGDIHSAKVCTGNNFIVKVLQALEVSQELAFTYALCKPSLMRSLRSLYHYTYK